MKPLTVAVRYEDRVYHAAVEYDTRTDQLLLKSMYHFGLDPHEKHRYRLRVRDEERTANGLYLDRALGDQMTGGGELVLEPRNSDHQRLSTGSY